MAVADNSQTQTISSVTETAATGTVLGRTLIEDLDNGGVFPEYSVTCSYETTMFQVDENGNKIHIIKGGVDPHTFVLDPVELYTLYMINVVATLNGQDVTTTLGELLCDQVDLIIQNRKLSEVITGNPSSQTANAGDTISLSISLNMVALSYVNYSIAWYKNGCLLPCCTTPEVSEVVTDTTTFYAMVTTPFGVAQSDTATITVISA